MGKSYRDRPDKWRHQINKKNKNKKHRGHQKQEWETIVDRLADDYDNSIGGRNDYSYQS